jgi:hypothetical protein
MKRIACTLLICFALAGCGADAPPPPTEATAPPPAVAAPPPAPPPEKPRSLIDARKGFTTALLPRPGSREPLAIAPPDLFRTVSYDAPAGKLAAYVTPDPKDGQKHPAIVWMTGGDSNTIGDVWSPASPANDQTAAQYREAGIVMMFPSLRGGNENPGTKEGFLGEVDDILAAADYLSHLDYVDPARIYLGGHSTGGTLVLLVAESSSRFRAIFAFGAIDEIDGYGSEYLPFDARQPRELELRSPGRWLDFIATPTFVFEGAVDGNMVALVRIQAKSKNPQVHFVAVEGADHFSVLAPMNRLIASGIRQDIGPTVSLAFPENAVRAAVGR